MEPLRRKTANLRVGRFSCPGASYFLSTCTKDRREALREPVDALIARDALVRLASDGDVVWLVGTVMPDHIHFLFELGDRLSRTQVLGKVKGLVSRKHSRSELLWQENAFEHRLREGEDTEDYAFYIFMNPYRAGLVPIDNAWPWWVCTHPNRFRFLEGLAADGTPQPEWLDRFDSISANLTTGE